LLKILEGDIVPLTRGAPVPDGDFDVVVHAAGKHRASDEDVIRDNMVGTQTILKLARERRSKNVYILVIGRSVRTRTTHQTGESPLACPTVYSAAKAGAEQLCIASGLPLTILRLVNVYGPCMQKWKFLPMCTRQIMNGEIVHGPSGSQELGPRV
jgi:nucleoside-diphosphate-sugar epimerase